MTSWFTVAGIAVALACPVSASRPSTEPALDSTDRNIPADIAQLGDRDPAIRRSAADALEKIGLPARRAVIDATKSDNPQIAQEALQVLSQLPWYVPDDTAGVKTLLGTYGSLGVPERIGIIAQLPDLPGGNRALLRLLSDDVSEDVCWKIEEQLVQSTDTATLSAARALPLKTSRPAQLVLAARSWLIPVRNAPAPSPITVDRPQALALLARAVELETATPSYDSGNLDFAFDELSADALEKNQPNEAARLRRLQCARIGVSRSTYPDPFFELLALHADFGPLDGFQQDLQTYDDYVTKPESLFVLGRLYSRLGSTLAAEVFYKTALAIDCSPDRREMTGGFLLRHGWADLATKEFRTVLERGNDKPDRFDVDARLRLSALAEVRGDDAEAADQMHRALEDHKISGGGFVMHRDGIEVKDTDAERALEIDAALYSLHATQSKGDKAATAKWVDELLRLGPGDPEAVLDVVPELKSRGQSAQAAKLFAAAYQPLKDRLDGGENDPSLLNELAWLCGRCGERLDEAMDDSNRALAAEPDSAAYLDTNAEVNFRLGHAADAVRLETLALKSRPHDKFMMKQLARFQGGAK